MKEAAGDRLEAFARLRVVVGALGSAAHAGWWKTEFLTAAGLKFLERLYPRTSFSAAVRATGVAAKALHDANIGRGGVYHLFRLPESLEREVDALWGQHVFDQIIRDLEPLLSAPEALQEQLSELAADRRSTDPGPRRLGTTAEIRNATIVAAWAGAYLHAFAGNYRVFPYVDTERAI